MVFRSLSKRNEKDLSQSTQTKNLTDGSGDLKAPQSSSNLENHGGRSLVWLGHQPPTLTTRVQIPATAPPMERICIIFDRLAFVGFLAYQFSHAKAWLLFGDLGV
jgi:hypothetical protein